MRYSLQACAILKDVSIVILDDRLGESTEIWRGDTNNITFIAAAAFILPALVCTVCASPSLYRTVSHTFPLSARAGLFAFTE
jgi:uncharacterized membrane-anchored protein